MRNGVDGVATDSLWVLYCTNGARGGEKSCFLATSVLQKKRAKSFFWVITATVIAPDVGFGVRARSGVSEGGGSKLSDMHHAIFTARQGPAAQRTVAVFWRQPVCPKHVSSAKPTPDLSSVRVARPGPQSLAPLTRRHPLGPPIAPPGPEWGSEDASAGCPWLRGHPKNQHSLDSRRGPSKAEFGLKRVRQHLKTDRSMRVTPFQKLLELLINELDLFWTP